MKLLNENPIRHQDGQEDVVRPESERQRSIGKVQKAETEGEAMRKERFTDAWQKSKHFPVPNLLWLLRVRVDSVPALNF